MKLDYCLSPHTKTNSKWIKYLNIRPETINSIEENTGTKLMDLGARFSSAYTKIRMIQRLAWPFHKDDTQIHEAFHILCSALDSSHPVVIKKKNTVRLGMVSQEARSVLALRLSQPSTRSQLTRVATLPRQSPAISMVAQ